MGSPVFLTVCVILPWLNPIRDSLWLSHCHPCQRHLIKVSIKFVTMTNIVLFMDRHVLNKEVIHSIHARVNCKTLWNQLVCRSFLVGFALFESSSPLKKCLNFDCQSRQLGSNSPWFIRIFLWLINFKDLQKIFCLLTEDKWQYFSQTGMQMLHEWLVLEQSRGSAAQLFLAYRLQTTQHKTNQKTHTNQLISDKFRSLPVKQNTCLPIVSWFCFWFMVVDAWGKSNR